MKKRKISTIAASIIVFVAALTLNFEKDQNGILSFSANLNAQTNPPPLPPPKDCFVRTTSKCGTFAGQGGGERVTCDLSGTFVAGSTCTPVKCNLGAQKSLVCSQPN